MSKVDGGITSMRTVGTFAAGRACSDTLFHVLSLAFGDPLVQEERAAMPLAGGIMQHGYQCGMIWGSALAAGARAYRLLGAGPGAEARAIVAAGRVVESFRASSGNVNCLEITETDMKSSSPLKLFTYFVLKGGTIGCFRMAARYAPIAFREIGDALSDGEIEAPPAPVSCAALVARKMGASDLHATMAAGFAGGVGLCGGACGALAAAIWIIGLRSLEKGASKVDYKSQKAQEAIDAFLACTDYEFECSEIAGRKFGSVADHARHVSSGGCAKIVEALSAR